MTAAELVAKLDADPDFQRRKAEKERKWAERRAAVDEMLRPILDDLRNAGITAESIEEMTQRYAPLPPQIVQVLLGWLPRVQDDRVKESLIRSLGAAREPFDGRLLVESFLHDTSETLRWPIANTMAEARPFGVADWLVEAVKKRSFGNARGMLVIALARLAPTETSLLVLLSVLDQLPGYVATAFGEVGGVAQLNALHSRMDNVQGWEKAEFLKAIRKIESRLRDSAAGLGSERT
jgi:hypothetical protein